MKYFECLTIFSFLLLIELSVSQTSEEPSVLQPECRLDRNGTACLDHNFDVKICYDINQCNYIFHCPENATATYEECYYDLEQGQCPNITALGPAPKYTRQTQLTTSNPILANSFKWNTEFRICAINMEDIFSNNAFDLKFDRISKKITVDTSFRIPSNETQNFVRCYQRNLDHLLETGLHYDSHISQNITGIYKYTLNITQEPNIYFCIVLALPLISLTKTKEVVGYTNASGNQYIAKVTFLGTIDGRIIKYVVDTILDEQCQQLNLNVCKIVKVKNNEIFLYAQDTTQRELKFLRSKAENVLNQGFVHINPDFSRLLQINYVRNIDYCPDSTTTSHGRILNWRTTTIENVTTPFEVCFDNNGVQVTRRCEGDFFTGAQWSDPSANCSEYCLPDTTTSSNGKELTWGVTLARTTTTPFELCLDEEGMQVTRRCEDGPQWSEPSGDCSDAKIPAEVSKLYQLIKEENMTEVMANITAETENFKQFTPVEVNLLSDGLKTVSIARNANNLTDDFFHSVSNLMQVNSTRLDTSQKRLNSTDKILDAVETFTLNIAKDITNLSVTIGSNILTQISYPFLSNVVGLGIYSNGQNNFFNYRITSLFWEETFNDLNLENLELAVYIPTDYIGNLTKNFTDEEKNGFRIINTVFYNDELFNDLTNENRLAGSRVISVNIPGLHDSSEIPIHILFRPVLNFTNPNCAFWDYGQQKYGEWSTNGGDYMGTYNDKSLMLCTFNHITHFALLVLSENIIRVEDEDGVVTVINPLDVHDLPLTLITLIGCGLSFMGLVGILLTATLFKGWYKKRLNTIQLGLIMLMEIIVLYVADLKILEGSACLAVGALLHYIVVSKFIWMLIIARIQYLKFVKIFDSLQVKSHVIIHMLIGWILPIIPVILGLLFFPDDYQAGFLNFCYAKDHAFYFLIMFPICIIILGNITVFVAIMASISKSKAQDYGVNMQKIQIRLGIMLLFMLGITWIFGIISEFLPWGWSMLLCLYFFCILGSVQGFVLFVFTVILDKATMELWADLYKIKSKRDMPYEGSTRSEVLFTSCSEQVTVNYFGERN